MGDGRAALGKAGKRRNRSKTLWVVGVALLFGTTLLLGCIKRVPPAPSWALTVEQVFAPVGKARQAGDPEPLLRCSADGKTCRTLKISEPLAPGERVRSSQGSRARLGGAYQAHLWLGEQGEALIVKAEQPTIELAVGQLVVDGLAGSKVSLRFVGHSATLDGAMPTRATVRTVEGERVEVTVTRGRLQVRDPANTLTELHSGDSVRFARSGAPERGDGALWLDPERILAANTATATPKPSKLPGLGSMTARVPGTKDVVGGVRLAAHSVRVSIRDGLARTEIEECFENTTGRVLEGRYVFQLPPDASVSRLALWVGEKLMEGEVVERKRAASIFRSIVEDTVRPRDPALLEWIKGADVSLKVFPIAPHSRRRLLLAYDQVLPMDGSKVNYVYPLATPGGRETTGLRFTADLSINDSRTDIRDVTTPGYDTRTEVSGSSATVHYESDRFVPSQDLVLSYRRDRYATPDVLQFASAASVVDGRQVPATVVFLARLRPTPPANQLGGALVGLNRVFVLDASHSQSPESLKRAAAVTHGLLDQMDPDEHFAILACDSACDSFPTEGKSAVVGPSIQAAVDWLRKLEPHGASDLAGTLIHGIRRLGPDGKRQLIYIGDGTPTVGELVAERLAQRVSSVRGSRALDLRLFGLGSSVDELTLGTLANTLGATYQRLTMADPPDADIARLGLALRQPVIVGAKLTAPPGITEIYPQRLPNLNLGQELLVVGKGTELSAGQLTLSGQLGNKPYQVATAITPDQASGHHHPLLPRLWAGWRIAEFDASDDQTRIRESVELSRRFRVMSRHAAWLVLESEAMYREFGLKPGAVEGPAERAWQPEALEMATLGALSSASPANGSPFVWGHTRLGGGGDLKLSGGAATGPVRPGASGGGLADIGSNGKASQPGSSTTATAGFGSAPRGTVNVGAPAVVGGTIANAGRVVAGMRAGFRNCFNRELSNNPDAQGTIRLTIAIGSNGEILSVAAAPSGNLGLTTDCVRARFLAAQFDPPEGESTVRITVPLNFVKTDDARRLPSSWSPPPPQPDAPEVDSVTYQSGSETWRKEGDVELVKLRRAVADSSQSRLAHESLIRGLLRRGRPKDALAAAMAFAELDPELALAQRLLAYAAAAVGDAKLAVTTLDALSEIDPNSTNTHASVARSFVALGDEPRACAHFRALADLQPRSDEYFSRSLGCRYRLFDERDSVLSEARAVEHPGTLLAALIAELESGSVAMANFLPGGPEQFKVTVQCEAATASCPTPLVVTPSGTVLSPYTPGQAASTRQTLQLSWLQTGMYRILLMGANTESHGTVECRILGNTRKFEFAQIAPEHTIASANVYVVPRRWDGGGGLMSIGPAMR